MKFSSVEDQSWMYSLVKAFPIAVHNYIFYRKIYTTGLENIPEEGAVIFAPNHQNALMDALILISVKNWQPVFMARADIFAGQFLRRFLFFCKILPIFRIRDGKESLKENNFVFQKAVEVLKKKRFLVIYPEASHKGIHRLRPLKKGITRIAFMAEEATNYTLGVKIIPVGINYQDYYDFRTDAMINFGKPINVEDYAALYKENPQKANHQLVEEVKKELSTLIIDIQDTENYDNFETAREILAPYLIRKNGKLINNFKNQILAGKEVVGILGKIKESDHEEFEELAALLKQYREGLNSTNLTDRIIRKKYKIWGILLRTVILIATFPINVFGFVNNFVPYHLPFLLTMRVKDRNFHTSVRFVLYLILFPVFYGVIFWQLCRYTDSWLFRILYMLLVPLTGIFSHRYYAYVKKVAAMWKMFFNKKKPLYARLGVLRDKIVEIFKRKI
ncbi:MAG: 1-acyl-sn-glycerol-3-phosphate acyltransferase [Bacteroidales bacterium]|nr:1-acyl-sn-glycerol-3-phosphate acyltransferase [Bacteroidales bacterium]